MKRKSFFFFLLALVFVQCDQYSCQISDEYILCKVYVDGDIDYNIISKKNAWGPPYEEAIVSINQYENIVYWMHGGGDYAQLDTISNKYQSLKELPSHVQLMPVEQFWELMYNKQHKSSSPNIVDIFLKIISF